MGEWVAILRNLGFIYAEHRGFRQMCQDTLADPLSVIEHVACPMRSGDLKSDNA
jgi:hypothetical protein